jgi:branched-subunit amino acid ABC-type transport system permease component
VLIAPIIVAAIGVAVETGFIRPLYRRHHLDQVLLTFGFTLVFYDLVETFGGMQIYTLATPGILAGSIHILGNVIPVYHLFLVALGFGVGGSLWWFIDRSRIGAMVRAGVDDSNMAAGVGINVGLLFTSIFAVGAALAGLAGVAAGPELGIYAGMDVEILIPAFIVIVIGGTGSLRGAFGGSLIVGEADTFGKAYLPEMAMFLIYILMIAVLLTRPDGLFGRAKAT